MKPPETSQIQTEFLETFQCPHVYLFINIPIKESSFDIEMVQAEISHDGKHNSDRGEPDNQGKRISVVDTLSLRETLCN